MKQLIWIGSSKKDLRAFPSSVRHLFGQALYEAQTGGRHPSVKSMVGMRGVQEIVDDYDGDTYRAVYTVKLANVIYVLHTFQKKSKKGIRTPKRDLDLIERRLKEAEAIHRARRRGGVKK